MYDKIPNPDPNKFDAQYAFPLQKGNYKALGWQWLSHTYYVELHKEMLKAFGYGMTRSQTTTLLDWYAATVPDAIFNLLEGEGHEIYDTPGEIFTYPTEQESKDALKAAVEKHRNVNSKTPEK
jgi:hypothetical protein